VLEPDGKLAFYFLDAYENPDRPDTAYFFGKVPVAGGKFQSCCAVVGGLHYSLIVVPAPWVFADGAGDIAAAEARVAEHPEDKVELLKLLHVSGTGCHPGVSGGVVSGCPLAWHTCSKEGGREGDGSRALCAHCGPAACDGCHLGAPECVRNVSGAGSGLRRSCGAAFTSCIRRSHLC
jgi:hypothetical protein